MKISRKMKKVCGLVLSLALISSFIVIGVGGNSGGRFNVAQTGCGNGCHGPEDPTITVLINGLPVEYTPTQAYALTIDVSGGPATTRGGFNLEITAGTLSSADVNVLIDTPPVQAAHENEDARFWSLDWTAPTSGIGDVTFYLAGMACGDPTNKDGDSWKLISTIVPEFVPANTPPTIDLTYPDGGQDWTGGFAKRLWWNMSDTEDTDNTQLRVWVNYSVDSGASWMPIAGAQNIAGTVNPNSYDWTVPTIDTNLARINVTVQDTGGLRTRDTSLADFTIDSTPPTVILTNPFHWEIDVPTNANFETTFSEPMDQNSAENAFELYNTFNWALVNGVIEPWVGDMMIFNPGGNLAPGMLYSANISSILNRATDDSDPGNEMAYSIFNFVTVDDAPPEVSSVLIDNQPIRTVPAGTIVTLNATINDVWTGFSNISASNYTIGWQNWVSAVSMNAEDGAFDQVLERVTVTIDTAGWIDGTYDIYVYGSDDIPNHNTTSIQHAILIVSSDFNAPEVSNVMINGAATQTYPLSSIPTLTLTATIDDSPTGTSNVTGANYTEGDSNWPGTDMNAVDGTFDSPIEDVTIDIIPIPTVPSTYYYYVYGWDDKLNYNTTSTAYATLTIVDDLPPEVLNVLVDGLPTVTVQPGATVILTATIDDTRTGGSIIGGANNTTGPANWATSAPMNPITPPLDSPIEDFIQAIDTTGWLMGSYDMYVYGWDDATGSNSTSQAFATIIISADIEKPEIFNVLIDGQPTATVFISSLPPTVTLTATIDDTKAGGSNVGGANYTTPTMTSFPGTDMNAVLPPFDSIIEDVTATITTPTLAGTYNYYVYAWDEYLNANTSAPYATLIVVDDMQPQISNVLIDGLTTATYGLSGMPQTVSLSATISDSATGNSMISGANYTTPTATSWPGNPMFPTGETPPVWDDEISEDVNTTIDISAYAPGSHRYYVYAWDEAGNYNNDAPYATLVIVDDVPPTVSNALIDGQTLRTVFEGAVVTLNATIDDTNTGGSDILGANYTEGAQTWPGIVMTALDGSFNSLTEVTTVTIDTTGMDGTYEVYVYGWDSATPTSNYNTTSTAYATLVVNPSPVNTASVRVLDGCTGPASAAAEGLVWAVEHGADICNLSLQYYPPDEVGLFQGAVNYAHANGVLVVAAAGNNVGNEIAYPAILDNCMAVSATDRNDDLAGFSNWGDELDVSAPGKAIYSTTKGDTYAFGDGTSMASPHVAGLAALIKSYVPGLTHDEIRSIINDTADDLWPPGWDDHFGYGRINASAAMLAADETSIRVVSSDPPDEAIDARQPSEPNGDNPAGWQVIELTFDGDVSALSADAFSVVTEGGTHTPQISDVVLTGFDTVAVVLDSFIPTVAWTTIRHDFSGTSVRLGYLPGDADGDRTTAPADILAVVDALNGVANLEIWQTDLDRDGYTAVADILRVIDLLNGAGTYEVYLDVTLPR